MDYQDLNKMSLDKIISLTLREKQESDTIKELMNNFCSIQDLLEVTIEELQKIKGIGLQKALALKGAIELGKRLYLSTNDLPTIIRCPEDVAQVMKDMAFLDREYFKVIHLNTKNHINHIETVSIGSLNSTIVTPREVFKTAIKKSTACIIGVHNHPSSDPNPSNEDIELSKRLKDVGKLISIEFLDHVIIGGGRFVSLKERGLI